MSRPAHTSQAPVPLVHFITELETGGAQMALYRLLTRLEPTRYAPTVLCWTNGNGAIGRRIRDHGIAVHDLGMTGPLRIDALGRLLRQLRQQRPAILHTWMFHANVPGRIAGRLAGVPIIISGERTMGQESKTRLRLNRATANLADRITCVSPQVATFARTEIGLPPDKLTVIPNGVDTALFRPRRAESPDTGAHDAAAGVTIGFVGRLQPVKDVALLLQACARLQADHPALRLHIVGDGPLRGELEKLAADLDLTTHVRWFGDRQDIPQLLPDMDIFVLPSRWEGMPNAVLEAMACGLPVVATGVGGTIDVVTDGATGLLTAPESVEQLTAALHTLLADPGLRQRMGAAGRRRVEAEFSLAATVAATTALYESLLAARHHASVPPPLSKS